MRHAVVIFALLAMMTPATAQEFKTFKGHGGPIMGLDVGATGQLASASFDNSVGLWTEDTPRWLEGHDAAVVALHFAANGGLLSGGDDFRVLRWEPGSGTPLELARHTGKVADIASHKTAGIATAGWDGFIQRIADPNDTNSEPLVLKGHRSNVTAVDFAPDGTLYSASSDGTVRVWNGTENRVLTRHGFGINTLVVTEDWIAYGAIDGGSRMITREGELISNFTMDRRPILAMDYHAPTGQLAVGDGHGYIMMISPAEGRITRDFRAMRQGPVWALAFSEDGTTIHAGGIDDVIYAWPVALLDQYDPAGGQTRSFLRAADSMPNGERQFMRKCSICHALEPGASRKAGPTLHGVFGRRAGTVPGYSYSPTLTGSDIIWGSDTIDALFEIGPDHYIPGSKMPMQVIAAPSDRADLITFLEDATTTE